MRPDRSIVSVRSKAPDPQCLGAHTTPAGYTDAAEIANLLGAASKVRVLFKDFVHA
jgi:hypothetical protein